MASTIKVDNVQNQPGTNIINKCGTTITLGASSDTIALAAGASQTGFGRTGTVDWITTPKVTGDSPITAVTGKGYFLNTTAGVITINLPAGAAGSIVSMADYAATWNTYNVTVAANGAEKIGGIAEDALLNTQGQSVTFVYVDGTQGWVNTMDSTSNVRGLLPYVAATGGTPCSGAIVCTNYKVHTFTGPGTFIVTNAGAAPGSNTVDYMVIGGGGGGGSGAANYDAGGAGAGGFRESPGTASGCYSVSPLGASPAVALSVPVASYPIVVGSGGAGTTYTGSPSVDAGVNGSVSSFSSITSAGGGGGGSRNTPSLPAARGQPGASGGGAGQADTCAQSQYFGTGNTPPTTPAQGTPGGRSAFPVGTPSDSGGGGGGGATVVGSNATCGNIGGNGGAGATTSISATPTVYAGGGGGAGTPNAGGNAGPGGGGTGSGPGQATTAGTVNLGGGGGAGSGAACRSGGNGGSGVVVIRYKFQ